MKKVAVINDLSGFGRCSLIAAISTISAMGVQPCPLPTAILSAQTGYPSFFCDDYTDKMENFRSEWEKMQVSFDGIYTGFIASDRQIEQIFRFLDTFHKENTFLIVDPIMGDDGVVYKLFTDHLLEEMKRLAYQADIVTPNLTELCLLTNADYASVAGIEDKDVMIGKIRELALELQKKGPKLVIVTGIRFFENGVKKIGNLAVSEDADKLSAFEYIGGSFSGTGDLFASIIAGGIARGEDVFSLMDKAGAFIRNAMADSMQDHVQRNDGANYEKFLGMLLPEQQK